MGYEESLRQAREMLLAEIDDLRDRLAKKEMSLRKIEEFLQSPARSHGQRCLTHAIVELVYRLVVEQGHPITAKEVVQAFCQVRSDVNESTIRSTLYQVSRKQKPTVLDIEGQHVGVSVVKDGPTYDVSVAGDGGAAKCRA